MSDEHLVIDASALVDLVLHGDLGQAVGRRIEAAVLHAPAHIDAEVLSALGRLCRAGSVAVDDVSRQIGVLASAPIQRHCLADLLGGAWDRRERVRLVDALYLELAAGLDVPLVTTDAALGRADERAEVVVR